MSAPTPLEQMLRQLASMNLPCATDLGRTRRLELDDRVDPVDLVTAAEVERLLGPLHHAVMTGAVDFPDDATAYLAARHEAALVWCLMLEVRLLEVRDWFNAGGGVEHLVIKGPAVAHLDEVDPSLRSFADIDILVTGADVDRAVAILEQHGATRPWPERRPGFDRRFAKSVTMTSPDGIEIDLHRSLCDGVYGGRLSLGDLFAEATTFELGGELVGALSRPHRLLHAVYHAVLGSPTPRLSSLRDIAKYLSAADLSPAIVVPIAQRWRGEAVLATAVAATLDTLDISAPRWARWRTGHYVERRELALIARQKSEGSSFGRAKLDLVRELPRLGPKAAYIRAVLWPTGEHLQARELRRAAPLRRVIRRADGQEA